MSKDYIPIYRSRLSEPLKLGLREEYSKFVAQSNMFLRELFGTLENHPNFGYVDELCASEVTSTKRSQNNVWRMEYDQEHGLFIIKRASGSCTGIFNIISGTTWDIGVNARQEYHEILRARAIEIVEPILSKYPIIKGRQEEELLYKTSSS